MRAAGDAMHCSDDQLLAHLDGELPLWRSLFVRRHLKSCWRCRTRQEASEQQIRRLTLAMDEWHCPPPGWRAEARNRLATGMRVVETNLRVAPHPSRRWLWPVFSAAALLVLAAAGYLWTALPRTTPRPAAVVARAASQEMKLYKQPVHQTLAVRIAEIRPASREVKARLQIWSDGDSSRFSSRLTTAGGALVHALWRPAADREFVYRTAAGRPVRRQPHRVETPSLAALADDGLDVEQIEAAFIRWMETRDWNPVSFTDGVAAWSASGSTPAVAERINDGGGAPLVRVTVRRQQRQVVAVIMLDVDAGTYTPRLQTIRFETPERAVELQLAASSVEPMTPAELRPALFEPDPAPAGVPPPSHSASVDRGEPDAVVSESLLPPADLRDMQARFELHRAGACLGEPVRVAQTADGATVVRVGADAGAAVSKAGMEPLLKALAEIRRTAQSGHDSGSPLAGAVRHAAALEQLAYEFGAWRTPARSDESFGLLASMVGDHVSAIQRELESVGLSRPVPGGIHSAAGWRHAAAAVARSVNQLNELQGHALDGSSADLVTALYDSLDELSAAFPAR